MPLNLRLFLFNFTLSPSTGRAQKTSLVLRSTIIDVIGRHRNKDEALLASLARLNHFLMKAQYAHVYEDYQRLLVFLRPDV